MKSIEVRDADKYIYMYRTIFNMYYLRWIYSGGKGK